MKTTTATSKSPLSKIYPSRLCIGDLKELLIKIWNVFDPGWEENVVRFKGKKYLDGGLEFEIEYLSDRETGVKFKYNLSVLPNWEIGDLYMTWQTYPSTIKRFKSIFGTDNTGLKSHLQSIISQNLEECDFDKYPLVRPALINNDWIVFQLLDLNKCCIKSGVYNRKAIVRNSSHQLR
jgi:hypothetical protein